MFTELIQLSFDKIIQSRAYTVVVLKTKEKKFPIYVDPAVGRNLQAYLTDTEHARPQTYDLISSFCPLSRGNEWRCASLL